MTHTPASRAPFSPAPTLGDVLAAIAAADLPPRRREDLASAVRSAARAIGHPPEELPADARLLARRLSEVAIHAIGMSARRWNNIRSLVRSALGLVQDVSPGRSQTQLTPSWSALRTQVPTRSQQIRLGRFMRFCSARGIEPEDVSDTTFVDFRAALDRSLMRKPQRIYREFGSVWNCLSGSIKGWPGVQLAIPDRGHRWVKKWCALPPTLRDDAMRWLDRLSGNDILEDLPFRPVRPTTRQRRDWQIRAFATALILQDHTPSMLSDLVAVDAFKSGLRFFLARHDGKSSTAIIDQATTMKAIARHHVGVGAAHLQQLQTITRRLETGRRGLTERNRNRLRALDDPANAEALVRLPIRLMNEAKKLKGRRAALLAQTAVAIEILLMAPVRISNLVGIDRNKHLVRPRRDRPALHLVIEGEEVKNGESLEYPLPAQTIGLIELYIAAYLPLVAPAGSTALFPGRKGGARSRPGFGQQISRTIFEYTGLRIHPHLFRHAGAKLFLDQNPGAYEVVRRVLGHRSIDTTTNFYTGLETASAVRHFDQSILKLRQRGAER